MKTAPAVVKKIVASNDPAVPEYVEATLDLCFFHTSFPRLLLPRDHDIQSEHLRNKKRLA